MKPRSATSLVLLLIALAVSRAWARDDVTEKLKTDYQGKTLTLRHFYQGNHLVFQSNGELTGRATIGPWTVNGQISITSIEVHDHTVKIRGRRVCLAFDPKAKPFRDVVRLLQESEGDGQKKMVDAFLAKGVKIDVQLTSDHPGLMETAGAMNAVFLTSGESLRDFVPDYWQSYFSEIEGKSKPADRVTEPTYAVGHGVSPPRATSSPNPDFSEEARLAKYQGTTTLSMIVDSSGQVRDLAILSPLGLGLDERAVAAVSTWKFKPAMKEGQPVAVKIAVEVDFHLY
jgi:TonB family protein